MNPLESEAAENRLRALDALGEDDTGALVEALLDESWRVRRLAVDRLSTLDATPWLLRSLTDLLGRRDATEARNAAASVLGSLGAPAVPALRALLGHSDPDQRKFAADILAGLKRPETVPALVDALYDADENVRAAAAEALGHIGGPEATRALVGLLDAREPLLRVCALEGLAAQHAPPSLLRLLPHLDDPLTRKSAFRVLGHVTHPAALARVAQALIDPPSREGALRALAVRKEPVSAEAQADLRAALNRVPNARDWLQSALLSEDLERQRGALHLVLASKDASLAPEVASSAATEAVAPMAVAVLNALGAPALHRLLEGSPCALATMSRDARAIIGEAVVRLSDRTMVAKFVELLQSGDPDVAELAARALGHSRAVLAVAPLVQLLSDEALGLSAFRAVVDLFTAFPDEVRAALQGLVSGTPEPWAVRAWAEVAGEDALEVVKKALRDERDAVRAAAAEAGPSLGAEALSALSAALMDESVRVRAAAARALGRIASDDAGKLLERALDDEAPSVLALAARAAGERGAAATVRRLEALAIHADVSVSLAAVQALGRLGALSDEVLMAAAAHSDAEVLKLVLTLGADRLTVLTMAVEALTHAKWDVRVAAGRALAVGGPPGALRALEAAVERESDALARELLETAAATLASR